MGKHVEAGRSRRATFPDPQRCAASSRKRPGQPRTEIEQQLWKIWTRSLGTDVIGIYDDFFAIGGASLQCLEMLGMIEDQFGVRPSMERFLSEPTIVGLSSALAHEATGHPLLVRLSGRSRVGAQLVLVHAIGGHVMHYYDLARALPWTIFGLEARGFADSSERIASSIVEMARDYCEALLGTGLAKTCIVGGYSFGAVVALEMSLELQRRGENRPIVLIDPPDLQLDSSGGQFSRPAFLSSFFGEYLAGEVDHERSATDLIKMVVDALATPGDHPRCIHPMHAREVELVLANAEAMHDYHPEGIHRSPALFILQEDQSAGGTVADSPQAVPISWYGVCPNARVIRVRATHGDILKPPRVHVSAAAMEVSWASGWLQGLRHA